MNNHWDHILTIDEIDAYFAGMKRLDPRMAAETRRYYENRTDEQLASLTNQAWQTSNGEAYQLARSFAALTD